MNHDNDLVSEAYRRVAFRTYTIALDFVYKRTFHAGCVLQSIVINAKTRVNYNNVYTSMYYRLYRCASREKDTKRKKRFGTQIPYVYLS